MKDIVLNENEKEIVYQLLLSLKKSEYSLSYKELSERLSFKPNPHFGLTTPLYHIGLYCYNMQLPFITFMVVKENAKVPGEGCKVFFEKIDTEEKSTKDLFLEEREKIRNCSKWQDLADSLNIDIKMPARGEKIYPERIPDEKVKALFEGAKKTIVVNAYERDEIARKECIDFYTDINGKISCQICGFNFGDFYGDNYENLIHIHHIVPLSSIKKTYRVNPQKDLIPVCPNCHMVLHSKVGETVEELRDRLNGK